MKKNREIMVSVINKPLFTDFLSLAAGSERYIKICAPFIKAYIIKSRSKLIIFSAGVRQAGAAGEPFSRQYGSH